MLRLIEVLFYENIREIIILIIYRICSDNNIKFYV